MITRISRSLVSLAIVVVASHFVGAQSGFTNIPGIKTANGIMASATDGMSRYLAQDGPIQPAITAIGGLPMRGVEYLNRGISSISSGLSSSAQAMNRNSANTDGQIRMPGLETAASMMPSPISSLGSMMQSGIRTKNQIIMNQGKRGVEAANRLGEMMSGSMQVRSSAGPMSGAHSMMEGAHQAMSKGLEDIKGQMQQSMSGTMGRMQQMHGMGEQMRGQVQGLTRTITGGLQRSASELSRTGQEVASQLQGGMKSNSKMMSGVLGSLQGSMGNMGQNMQKNFHGLVQHAQRAAHQMSGHLQQAVRGPMDMLSNLGSSFGGMMNKGGSMSSSGKY